MSKTTEAIAFTILGGYLGAGKTTLLNRLLKDNHGVRIALLINDFGAINIDAELIEEQTDQQINLTNGCVCCGLTDGFDAAIEQLARAEKPPEHIVIEASGVADVQSLAQYGKAPGLALNAVVVVADATSVKQKSRDKYVATTVKRQLAAADILLLNKIDLVPPEQASALPDWLRTVNAHAPILQTTFCKVPYSLLLGSDSLSEALPGRPPSKNSAQDSTHNHHETYVTWNHQSERLVTREQAEAMLSEFPADLLRGKGFIATSNGCLEWHKVGRYQRLTESSQRKLGIAAKTELVAIGLKGQLPLEALSSIASRYLGESTS